MSFIIYYNVRVILYIRKVRNLTMSADQRADYRREIKLFVQCFITTGFFCFVCIDFITINTLGLARYSKSLCSTLSIGWAFHHGANSMVYFVINKQLRTDLLAVLGKSSTDQATVQVVAQPVLFTHTNHGQHVQVSTLGDSRNAPMNK